MTRFEVQPHQILYLEHQASRLYAEAIQIVPDRQLCWARPLALFNSTTTHPDFSDPDFPAPIDLRQASDLLLPLSWFQLALDVEAVPLLAHLQHSKAPHTSASDCLRSFIQAVYQTHREKFHSPVQHSDRSQNV